MTTYLILPTFVLLGLTGLSFSSTVNQSPSAQIERPAGTVNLSCSHGNSGHTMILWYKQVIGYAALELIGHVYLSNENTEDAFKGHVFISGSGRFGQHADMFYPDVVFTTLANRSFSHHNSPDSICLDPQQRRSCGH
ncbi:hypothetical protein UPYG_G00227790 [Umbra pygmaea]|uniref:Immunoglobulin V-set domain-containing protein n=1 Tax=Umbra pygmaea TaxID=75934 RepID=A0ABD0WHN7_UMBPY